MAINFPDSPNNGDSFTSNNKTWVFDGTVWNITSGTNSVADGAITTAKLATGAVTAAKLGNDISLTPADGSITAAKIASDAVTTAKILDANVTETKIASNAVTEAKIASNAVTTGKLGTDVQLGYRNVVINGAMQVAQRGTSTASITGNGYYTADRWNTQITTLGTWTQSVENDAPTGSGFRKSLKMLISASAESPIGGTNDLCMVEQVFEGQNLQHFLKGTSSAKQLTLSFWVKSNVTGTYICRFNDFDNTRTVASSYSISASATWEKKTITFPADTTGAFDNDNAVSLRMQFWLAAGSAFTSGTLATTWQSTTNANIAVGQTNLAAATNNYWQITGVQLEAGSVATPFEFEDYGVTLVKCQRYYYKLVSGGAYTWFTSGWSTTATSVNSFIQLPITMRATPNVIDVTGSFEWQNTSNNTLAASSFAIGSTESSPTAVLVSMITASGTANIWGHLRGSNSATAAIGFGSEL